MQAILLCFFSNVTHRPTGKNILMSHCTSYLDPKLTKWKIVYAGLRIIYFYFSAFQVMDTASIVQTFRRLTVLGYHKPQKTQLQIRRQQAIIWYRDVIWYVKIVRRLVWSHSTFHVTKFWTWTQDLKCKHALKAWTCICEPIFEWSVGCILLSWI